MTGPRAFMVRLGSLVRARRLDARLDEEIQAHLELAAADHIARGLTPEAARRAALRDFGGVVRTKEAWREARGVPGLDAAWPGVTGRRRGSPLWPCSR